MSVDELVVILEDQVAAHLTRSRGAVRLTYEDSYLAAGGTPLSVSMPLTDKTHSDRVVAPWIDGLLPDNTAVRRAWSRQFAVSDRPFSLLSSPVGEECAGAARFVTPDRVEPLLAGQGHVDWLTEAEVAQRLRGLRQDSSAWLGADFTGRFSLAGAQAKMALLHQEDPDRWGLPSGAAATSHILKPAIAGLDGHDLNEHLCLRAAALAGMPTAATRIVSFEDISAVAATRYDRASGTPWLTRIHQEDLCQALGRAPEDKYESDGGPTTTQIVDLLRTVLPADQALDGVWRFFDAVTFNWLIAGTDAHAKNYSLLLAGPQVALAPLYDIASALPYGHLRDLKLAMRYAKDYTLLPRDVRMWSKVAREFGLPPDAVRERARELIEVTPDAFSEAASTPQVSAIGSALPARLTDLVSERVAACRKALS